MMPLSGAAWSFVGATLRESVDIWRSLGVHAIDLIAVPGAILDPRKIIEKPEREAGAIRELDSSVANLIFAFGSGFSDRALNDKDPEVRRRNAGEFEAVLEFCRLAQIRSITALPGVVQPEWTREKSVAVAAEVLNELTLLAAKKEIGLFFEPHVESLFESPAETLRFLHAHEKLRITLDYSHFVYSGSAQDEIDCLGPYAGHVHLRQGAPRVLQARWNEGVIDFGKVVRVLQQAGFSGYYALEYEHDPWLGNDKVDVISESIKMRDEVKPLIMPSRLVSSQV
jgi:sugar phosphate isomerase/epimerase